MVSFSVIIKLTSSLRYFSAPSLYSERFTTACHSWIHSHTQTLFLLPTPRIEMGGGKKVPGESLFQVLADAYSPTQGRSRHHSHTLERSGRTHMENTFWKQSSAASIWPWFFRHRPFSSRITQRSSAENSLTRNTQSEKKSHLSCHQLTVGAAVDNRGLFYQECQWECAPLRPASPSSRQLAPAVYWSC